MCAPLPKPGFGRLRPLVCGHRAVPPAARAAGTAHRHHPTRQGAYRPGAGRLHRRKLPGAPRARRQAAPARAGRLGLGLAGAAAERPPPRRPPRQARPRARPRPTRRRAGGDRRRRGAGGRPSGSGGSHSLGALGGHKGRRPGAAVGRARRPSSWPATWSNTRW